MSVLVTGAGGLIGSEVLRILRERGVDVVGTGRRRAAAQEGVVGWDMLGPDIPAELRRDWDVIVHTAANTRWTLPAEEAERANVGTVAALAPLATRGTRVVHVSTAYALGLRGSVDSPAREDYRNTYEWSKAAAERLARKRFEHLTIVRPPLTIGRRHDGHALRFSGMYLLLRGITSSSVPAVVGTPEAYFDVVPVDDVARLLADVAGDGGVTDGEVLTIAGGSEAPLLDPALDTMVEALNDWRADRGLDPFDRPPLLDPESWSRFLLPFARRHLTDRQLAILELLENFQPYLEIEQPLRPTHTVTDVLGCLAASVRHWAEVNARAASMPPRPWKAAA